MSLSLTDGVEVGDSQVEAYVAERKRSRRGMRGMVARDYTVFERGNFLDDADSRSAGRAQVTLESLSRTSGLTPPTCMTNSTSGEGNER